jgi:hypothetical protein
VSASQYASTPADRLARIAEAHTRRVLPVGLTGGPCAECDLTWPCPTHVWATTDRNPFACWDPEDDQEVDP